MKKLGLTLVILLFAGMGMVNAQQSQWNNRPMQQNFRQKILPVVKAEQAKLIEALTTNEKKELDKIKEEMKAFRTQGKQIRESMKGNFNQQLWDSRRAAFDAIKVKADKLVAAHPKAARAYKEAVGKLVAQMQQARQSMQQGRMSARGGMMLGNQGNMSPQGSVFNRLSDPAFGLIMDPGNFGMNSMGMGFQKGGRGMNPRGMQPGQRQPGMSPCRGMRGQQGLRGRQGMRGQQGLRGQRVMNRPGRMQAGMRAMRNPEVQAQIKAYAKKNIFPVLSKERTTFDTKLNNKEKKQIAAARKQWEIRRAAIEKRFQNTNFVPGQRLNDSTRMAMRLEMEKTMIPVREIALKHYAEIQNVLTQIKGQRQQWRADIRGLINPGNKGFRPMQNKMVINRRMHRNGSLLFLIYDPANPQLPFMK